MWKLYRYLLRRSPRIVWETVRSIEGVTAVVFFIALLLNQRLGQFLMEWRGFSPLWCLSPLGLLLLHGLLRETLKFGREEPSDARLVALSELIDRGGQILDSKADDEMLVRWCIETDKFIECELGTSYLTRLRSFIGMQFWGGTKNENQVGGRLRNLKVMLAELQQRQQ